VALRDNRIVQDVSPEQCAKLCVSEGSFQCNSFDYCGNYSECRLSDASASSDGQTTLESTAYCDVYLRQYGSSNAPAPAAQTSDNSASYTSGSMGGIAVGMIILGIVLGLIGLVVYNKVRGGAGGDGMTISFSRQQDEES